MTTRRDETESLDEIDTDQLDAFVDGELSDDEQRGLLLRLDTDPDGWRRLALAFVEAQRWRRELRTVVADVGGSPAPPKPTRAVQSVRRLAFIRRVAGPLAITAAALLVGVALGHSIRDRDGVRHVARADSDAVPQASGKQKLHEVRPSAPGDGPSALPPVAMQIARIGFTDPASGEVRQIEAAVTGPPEAPILRLNEPIAALPEGLRLSLERAAFELITSQRVYPLRLETGEQIMLVGRDEADVRLLPTNRPVY